MLITDNGNGGEKGGKKRNENQRYRYENDLDMAHQLRSFALVITAAKENSFDIVCLGIKTCI